MNDIKLNVLILGKSGVGKSSLLNALFGKELAKTGTGKPVTGEGFYKYEEIINGSPVAIYDSWGLEAGKDKKWKELIDKELKNKGVDRPLEEWFHVIIYCIGASGNRIEEFDSNIIKEFAKNHYKVVVALNKADSISENDEKELISAIKEMANISNVVPICSVEQEIRGRKVNKFGIEDLEKHILDSWQEIFIDRIPLHIVNEIEIEIDKWSNHYKNNCKINLFNEVEWRKYFNKIQDELNHNIAQIQERSVRENIGKYFSSRNALLSSYSYSLKEYKVESNSELLNSIIKLIAIFYSPDFPRSPIHPWQRDGYWIEFVANLWKSLLNWFSFGIGKKEIIEKMINKISDEYKNSLKSIEHQIREEIKKILENYNK